MTRACGADDIKNILHPALFRKLRFQMIDDNQTLVARSCNFYDLSSDDKSEEFSHAKRRAAAPSPLDKYKRISRSKTEVSFCISSAKIEGSLFD
jgi:hypothetical protein